MGFVANFIRFPEVQKMKIGYTELTGWNFFETECIGLRPLTIVM